MCFKIHKKLNKKKEFDNVFLNGKSSFSEILGIKTILNDKKYNRVGIIVSTKISKKAVERNRIKRIIREIIKISNNKQKQGNDIVIITLPKILKKNFQEIEKEIEKNLVKLDIIKK